jgi:pimeloyl-ACP methyl ester carboxylesterase
MGFRVALGRFAAGFLLLAAGISAATAQLAPPRTLEELKTEIQDRADRKAYPVSQLNPTEVREALGNLKSQNRDEWAAVWSTIGDRHLAKAKELEAKDKAGAARAFEHAMEYYLFARFPLEDSPGTFKAYDKALEAFAGYARSIDPPIETVKYTYEGKEIVGYLRKPAGIAKPPVVLTIGGLDGRKENAAIRNAGYLKHGIAYLAMDMPGTGQTRILIEPGAEKVFSAALDVLQKRNDIDASRLVVYGGSWGGHWSARLAYTEKDRIRGAVVQGGPVHGYFQPEWQKKALSTREYLFGLFEARAAVYGVKKLDDFLAYGPKMSLADAKWLSKPSAPMFLINGARDTQVPISDLYVLLRSGTPKEAWVNPEGGHMGRTKTLSDQQIFETVTLPWVVRQLKEGS